MSQRVVYFNGEWVGEEEARVSIFDSALMYGDMAFEMTRTYKQRPFRLRQHLDRLYGSLRLLEIDCGLTIDEMEQTTLETLERNLASEDPGMDWQIMHDVSRGPLSLYRSVFPGDRVQPTVSINCWPLITHMGGFAPNYNSGVEVMIPAQQALPAHLMDMKAKTRSRLHYRMAELQAARCGGKWPLLLDPDGFLAEGPGWNIFVVRDGVIHTPQPRNILQGVSRGVTIELARQDGIEVRESNLGRYEALMADEMFCTATTYSLVHVTSFEGQSIGGQQPGPVYRRLVDLWRSHAGVDFIAQAHDYALRLPEWQARESSRVE